MSGHTPTPWSYKRAKFPTDGEFDCGITAPIGGTPFCIAETFGRCATTIKLNAEVNAAFIVKAVNSHEQMAQTLEALRDDPVVPEWIRTLATGSLSRAGHKQAPGAEAAPAQNAAPPADGNST